MGGRKNKPPVWSESRVHVVTPARTVAWSVTAIQRSSLTAVVSFTWDVPRQAEEDAPCPGTCSLITAQDSPDHAVERRHADVAMSGRVCQPRVRHPSFSSTLYPSPPAKSASSVLACL
jgi:hypothetical protein